MCDNIGWEDRASGCEVPESNEVAAAAVGIPVGKGKFQSLVATVRGTLGIEVVQVELKSFAKDRGVRCRKRLERRIEIGDLFEDAADRFHKDTLEGRTLEDQHTAST